MLRKSKKAAAPSPLASEQRTKAMQTRSVKIFQLISSLFVFLHGYGSHTHFDEGEGDLTATLAYLKQFWSV